MDSGQVRQKFHVVVSCHRCSSRTGIYLASQCYRYAVTKDESVRKAAWTHFEAMEFLHNVTGIPGYVARSFARSTDPYGGSWWYNSTGYPGWVWQGDTSSDSLASHMMVCSALCIVAFCSSGDESKVYPLVLRHLARNEDERARVLRLISLVTSYVWKEDAAV